MASWRQQSGTAIKFKRDLEITAEPYQRIFHEMKKWEKQVLITMFFEKEVPDYIVDYLYVY
ncbi:hypothetical protein T02_16487 [Trichinella nativa]|uniref:Uncharacterized protein n=1 Tax=Trichinella nativa TaxID=6335 RepID=A0A0V1LLJ9_9BILA|nr:hypothetical protein T02_16487 [Trichinella nativa]